MAEQFRNIKEIVFNASAKAYREMSFSQGMGTAMEGTIVFPANIALAQNLGHSFTGTVSAASVSSPVMIYDWETSLDEENWNTTVGGLASESNGNLRIDNNGETFRVGYRNFTVTSGAQIRYRVDVATDAPTGFSPAIAVGEGTSFSDVLAATNATGSDHLFIAPSTDLRFSVRTEDGDSSGWTEFGKIEIEENPSSESPAPTSSFDYMFAFLHSSLAVTYSFSPTIQVLEDGAAHSSWIVVNSDVSIRLDFSGATDNSRNRDAAEERLAGFLMSANAESPIAFDVALTPGTYDLRMGICGDAVFSNVSLTQVIVRDGDVGSTLKTITGSVSTADEMVAVDGTKYTFADYLALSNDAEPSTSFTLTSSFVRFELGDTSTTSAFALLNYLRITSA